MSDFVRTSGPDRSALKLVRVPGDPGASGRAHGREIAAQLRPSFLDGYLETFCGIKRLTRDEMRAQGKAWFDELPEWFQREIDGIATGARSSLADTVDYLYADIATVGEGGVSGPLCSAVLADGPRIVRNCDWYTALLTRGTAAVVHETPGRVPVMALGIYGDIDVDTGVNRAGLWLHAHTLFARPKPRGERPRLSWLFWLREALETCESVDDVDRMLVEIERDRGIILVCSELFSGRGAIFEAGIDTHTRADFEGPAMCATNHHRSKHPTDPARLARSREGSTTKRYERLLSIAGGARVDRSVLMDERVEMRTPEFIRTIYSAEVIGGGGRPRIWFASGGSDGTPAASGGAWHEVAWPWS